MDSAEQIAEKSLRPLLFKMDRNEPHLIDDQIRIHPGIKAIIRKFGEDGCEGYLVGEVNQGLKYMFQMMNEARLGVGMNAVGIASAAYQDSLAYAKERPQGRKVTEKCLSQPQVPIIEHADVKRMLLFQKSVVEGSLALLIYCAIGSDKIAHEEDPAEKNKMDVLLDLMTPIAKSYPSEMGVQSTSAAVQVLGGAGYTTDFPVEQYYREARIHPIHEGTTGIHGLDLLGRKILFQKGLSRKLLQKGIVARITSLPNPYLPAIAVGLRYQLCELKIVCF